MGNFRMGKTVLILGAGASKPFGLPLWKDLQEELDMLDLKDYRLLMERTQYEAKHYERAIDKYRFLQKEFPNDTLDALIYRMDRDNLTRDHTDGSFLLNIIAHLLTRREHLLLKDPPKYQNNWILQLQDHLVEVSAIELKSLGQGKRLKTIKNFTVISLNYDRVFEYYISKGFMRKLREKMPSGMINRRRFIDMDYLNKLKLYRPHGYISSVATDYNDDLGIDIQDHAGYKRVSGGQALTHFGNQEQLDGMFSVFSLWMYVVDEQCAQDYKNSNRQLRKADRVFCLGLSPDGLCQSSLKFRDGQVVYLNNGNGEFSEICSRMPGPGFKPLGENGSRLDARDFTRKFIDLAGLDTPKRVGSEDG